LNNFVIILVTYNTSLTFLILNIMTFRALYMIQSLLAFFGILALAIFFSDTLLSIGFKNALASTLSVFGITVYFAAFIIWAFYLIVSESSHFDETPYFIEKMQKKREAKAAKLQVKEKIEKLKIDFANTYNEKEANLILRKIEALTRE
jgi:predicted neutral ceramidase superfamily lipid hydrolase